MYAHIYLERERKKIIYVIIKIVTMYIIIMKWQVFGFWAEFSVGTFRVGIIKKKLYFFIVSFIFCFMKYASLCGKMLLSLLIYFTAASTIVSASLSCWSVMTYYCYSCVHCQCSPTFETGLCPTLYAVDQCGCICVVSFPQPAWTWGVVPLYPSATVLLISADLLV